MEFSSKYPSELKDEEIIPFTADALEVVETVVSFFCDCLNKDEPKFITLTNGNLSPNKEDINLHPSLDGDPTEKICQPTPLNKKPTVFKYGNVNIPENEKVEKVEEVNEDENKNIIPDDSIEDTDKIINNIEKEYKSKSNFSNSFELSSDSEEEEYDGAPACVIAARNKEKEKIEQSANNVDEIIENNEDIVINKSSSQTVPNKSGSITKEDEENINNKSESISKDQNLNADEDSNSLDFPLEEENSKNIEDEPLQSEDNLNEFEPNQAEAEDNFNEEEDNFNIEEDNFNDNENDNLKDDDNLNDDGNLNEEDNFNDQENVNESPSQENISHNNSISTSNEEKEQENNDETDRNNENNNNNNNDNEIEFSEQTVMPTPMPNFEEFNSKFSSQVSISMDEEEYYNNPNLYHDSNDEINFIPIQEKNNSNCIRWKYHIKHHSTNKKLRCSNFLIIWSQPTKINPVPKATAEMWMIYYHTSNVGKNDATITYRFNGYYNTHEINVQKFMKEYAEYKANPYVEITKKNFPTLYTPLVLNPKKWLPELIRSKLLISNEIMNKTLLTD